jgi:hypothetical protein
VTPPVVPPLRPAAAPPIPVPESPFVSDVDPGSDLPAGPPVEAPDGDADSTDH